MHEKRLVGIGLLLGILLMPTMAMACAICVEAQLWCLYPPIVLWKWVGLFWFITLIVIQNLSGNLVPRFPKGIISPVIGLVVVCLLGGSMLASVPFIALILFCIIPIVAVWKNESSRLGRKFQTAIYLSAVIPILFFAGTILNETINPTPRDPVSVILATTGTGVHRVKINKLAKQTPFPLESFRELVTKGDSYTVQTITDDLLKNGDLEIDIPICIDALERFENNHNDQTFRRTIEETLRKYTLLNLPKNSTAEQWRNAWEEKQT
jgi:hypothetical protein